MGNNVALTFIKGFTLSGSGRRGMTSYVSRSRIKGSKTPVGPNGPVAAGIYTSFAMRVPIEMTNGAIPPPEAIIPHAQQHSDGSTNWRHVKPKAKIIITVNNHNSPLHGHHIMLERLENGLFKLVNPENGKKKKNGPEEIIIDLEKAFDSGTWRELPMARKAITGEVDESGFVKPESVRPGRSFAEMDDIAKRTKAAAEAKRSADAERVARAAAEAGRSQNTRNPDFTDSITGSLAAARGAVAGLDMPGRPGIRIYKPPARKPRTSR